jgi:hypothetical protein
VAPNWEYQYCNPVYIAINAILFPKPQLKECFVFFIGVEEQGETG